MMESTESDSEPMITPQVATLPEDVPAANVGHNMTPREIPLLGPANKSDHP